MPSLLQGPWHDEPAAALAERLLGDLRQQLHDTPCPPRAARLHWSRAALAALALGTTFAHRHDRARTTRSAASRGVVGARGA